MYSCVWSLCSSTPTEQHSHTAHIAVCGHHCATVPPQSNTLTQPMYSCVWSLCCSSPTEQHSHTAHVLLFVVIIVQQFPHRAILSHNPCIPVCGHCAVVPCTEQHSHTAHVLSCVVIVQYFLHRAILSHNPCIAVCGHHCLTVPPQSSTLTQPMYCCVWSSLFNSSSTEQHSHTTHVLLCVVIIV
ncbi:hypothetical protein BsWGS_20471 [Bradybaena similaris]